VLADHKVEAEPEGGIERPTEIALIDTRDDTQQIVDLGSEYWFRSPRPRARRRGARPHPTAS
jgi:hypothetical protein